jgi:diguanylate cyclase (GGDEF)-like protein
MAEPALTHDPDPQALRLRRCLFAGATYVLGFVALALCSAVGLFPQRGLVFVGAAFALVNVVFFTLIGSGWNLRFRDPSLTSAQCLAGASTVALILTLGQHIHLLAVPFYSSLFVFAMLHMRRPQVTRFAIFVLASYGTAVALRVHQFGATMDLRVEAVHATLVVLMSIWYALAAGVIGGLRARLRSSLRTIEQLASRDALTDTWNRRHIDALLAAEHARQARLGGAVSLAMIDIDHFKSINDRFGHAHGDTVLRGVAQCMQQALRTIDPLGRFGGEEFLAVLPGTALPEAIVCAERLRAGVQALVLGPQAAEPVTVSIGVAELRNGETVAQWLARADAALYQAKYEGRNRVVGEASAGTPRTPKGAGPACSAPAPPPPRESHAACT